MQLRVIPDALSPDIVAEVDALLDLIERDHSLTIPLAIESGSRAWGFPSPDSDYDCRFVYVRHIDRYLSPWQARDVIETPLERELDVNGWDLGKALKLMLKGNAVIIEWLRSPIVYRGQARFRDDFLALAHRHTERAHIARHYLHLGERQRRTYFADEKAVPLKKLFYALRPAATLRWLRLHPDQAIAPMHFPTLMAECDPPAALNDLVAELLARKAETRELGAASLPQPIAAFLTAEFDQARETYERVPIRISETARVEAATFFRETVCRFSKPEHAT
jgi:predicted nucleotidyltransferase